MAIYVLVFLLIILRPLWMFFSSYILIPWRIRSIMAKQRVFGPPPRCFSGNIFDIASLVSTTTSSDMENNDHNIVGRLLPHYLLWSKQYGNIFIPNFYKADKLFTSTNIVKSYCTLDHLVKDKH